jgi:putative SOS response-associated peptidase YedK
MCGRYRIKDTDALTEHLRRTFQIPDWVKDRNAPRYNIAPSQDCPVVIMDDEGDILPVQMMRWGFVPFWETEVAPKFQPINAQAEKLLGGIFKHSAQKRRCLVPADGFYEWLRLDEKTKVPFDLRLKGGRPFVMAGVYEKPSAGRPATFAILTTSPNALMAKIHTRMPAILGTEEAKRWLQPGPITPAEVSELTAPFPAEEMEAITISSLVNSPRNDLPEILEPVAFTPPPKQPKETQIELF